MARSCAGICQRPGYAARSRTKWPIPVVPPVAKSNYPKPDVPDVREGPGAAIAALRNLSHSEEKASVALGRWNSRKYPNGGSETYARLADGSASDFN